MTMGKPERILLRIASSTSLSVGMISFGTPVGSGMPKPALDETITAVETVILLMIFGTDGPARNANPGWQWVVRKRWAH